MAKKKATPKKKAAKRPPKKTAVKKAAKKKAVKKKAKGAPRPSQGLSEVLGKALVDTKFREKLFSNPTVATKDFHLSKRDAEALKLLDRKAVEDQATALKGGRTAITVKVVISKSF